MAIVHRNVIATGLIIVGAILVTVIAAQPAGGAISLALGVAAVGAVLGAWIASRALDGLRVADAVAAAAIGLLLVVGMRQVRGLDHGLTARDAAVIGAGAVAAAVGAWLGTRVPAGRWRLRSLAAGLMAVAVVTAEVGLTYALEIDRSSWFLLAPSTIAGAVAATTIPDLRARHVWFGHMLVYGLLIVATLEVNGLELVAGAIGVAVYALFGMAGAAIALWLRRRFATRTADLPAARVRRA